MVKYLLPIETIYCLHCFSCCWISRLNLPITSMQHMLTAVFIPVAGCWTLCTHSQFIVLPVPFMLFLASALTAGFSCLKRFKQFSLQTLCPVGGTIILLYLGKLAIPPGNQTKPLSFILPHFLTLTKVKRYFTQGLWA